MSLKEQYNTAIKIRCFEEKILSLFGENKLSGTTHTYIGEEATAVSIMNFIKDDDVIFSNHRCHGHYLAYGGPEDKLMAEIMSKESGICQGRGGSQHIHYKNFFTNGIQGGIVPNALGVAFAKKLDNKKDNTIVFIGDGTLGQGVVYESLNIASIYKIPLMVVVEDNQYAMSTKRTDAISGDICKRISSFDIKTFEIESTNIEELNSFFSKAFEYIDKERKPVCAIVHNYRLGAHSKRDDTRPIEEIEKHRKNDPILLIKNRIGEEEYNRIRNYYNKRFDELAEALEKEDNIIIRCKKDEINHNSKSFLYSGNKRCVELMQGFFNNELEKNKEIVIYGEDVCDPYGGAFKVTKGLSSKFPNNIFNMPISEACMCGMAVGLAIEGKIPIAEMMFADFVALGFDQLLNHATKYAWVYGDNIKVPMIVRMASGGKRGYGPTHSQSLEKYLVGIPLLKVVALSFLINPASLYEYLIDTIDSPVAVIENKKLYSERIANVVNNKYDDFNVKETNNYGYPTIHLSLDENTEPDYYFVTYGGMTKDAIDASKTLMMNDEIMADVVVLTQLSPLPLEDLKAIINKKAKVVFIEEGTKTNGIGAEFVASCLENNIAKDFIRIAAYDLPIPNGIVLESQVVPDKEKIVRIIKENYYGK